jgi:hypothetical protein
MPEIISFDSTYTFEPVTFQSMIDKLKQQAKENDGTTSIL